MLTTGKFHDIILVPLAGCCIVNKNLAQRSTRRIAFFYVIAIANIVNKKCWTSWFGWPAHDCCYPRLRSRLQWKYGTPYTLRNAAHLSPVCVRCVGMLLIYSSQCFTPKRVSSQTTLFDIWMFLIRSLAHLTDYPSILEKYIPLVQGRHLITICVLLPSGDFGSGIGSLDTSTCEPRW